METFVLDTVYIKLETGKVVTGFTTMQIKYEKPDGTFGTWEAIEHPEDSTSLRTSARVTCADKGSWRAQAYIADADEAYHGKPAEFKVYSSLN